MLSAARFQSTRPRGARRAGYVVTTPVDKFQSTRPRGARPTGYNAHSATTGVSIHAPTRGATLLSGHSCRWLLFQSTRPRGARPWLSIHRSQNHSVSIHAPTRGATNHNHAIAFLGDVSIHAPTRGATLLSGHSCRWLLFQSTRPRGARQDKNAQEGKQSRFNPRAHAGRDGGIY